MPEDCALEYVAEYADGDRVMRGRFEGGDPQPDDDQCWRSRRAFSSSTSWMWWGLVLRGDENEGPAGVAVWVWVLPPSSRLPDAVAAAEAIVSVR